MMKYSRQPTAIFLLAVAAVFLSGVSCSKKTRSETLSPSQANQKFVKTLKEENNINILTTEFKQTVWVYLPSEEGLFSIQADANGFLNTPMAKTKPTIHFLASIYADQKFHITFDITSKKEYEKSQGYKSEFSEKYQTDLRHIMTAMYRVYSEIDLPPDFFIIVVADIVGGIEARTIIHFQDLKRAYNDQTFQEEYAKRIISEQPVGNINLINDRRGQSIDYADLTWPEFLAKQMTFRINFKYQRSAFPPSNDTRREILTIAADSVNAYQFDDFSAVLLKDLDQQTTFKTLKEDLDQYRSETSDKIPEGRLIHIKFQ